MIKHAGSLLLVGAAAFALTACSSSSNTSSSAQAQLSRINAATKNTPASSTASSPSGPKINPADVDVCALLSQADANSVAHAEQFDGFQDKSTFYKLTVTKQPGSATTSSCKFSIKEAQGDAQGTVTFHVRSAASFAVPPDGQTISGLGDEAYDTGVSPVVRVGSVVISSDDNSFPDAITVALLRKMVPKLK
ncbi:hypothetical protein [uncultured Jatrophihabitans sp.]|uniref:hypothetical protein n=1 Tax=uncultured Jatrophihabitans sp. TaxID=1610747 RepID=UPI0035CA4CB0